MTDGAQLIQTMDWFTSEMMGKLRHSRNLAKSNWRDETLQQLYFKLRIEMEELLMALELQNPVGGPQAIISECCDVANFAMFIADLARTKYGRSREAQRPSSGEDPDRSS